jgi:hypothetical protein
VGELRGSADDPEHGDRPERHHPHHPHHPRVPDAEAAQVRVDLRSRTEYAADLEQRAVSGWDQRPFRSFAGDRLSGASDEPLETVRRFEPSRAGLPDPGDAVTSSCSGTTAEAMDMKWSPCTRDRRRMSTRETS